MKIDKDSFIGSVDPGRIYARLDVLFKQEQVVDMIDGNGTMLAEEAEQAIGVTKQDDTKIEEDCVMKDGMREEKKVQN